MKTIFTTSQNLKSEYEGIRMTTQPPIKFLLINPLCLEGQIPKIYRWNPYNISFGYLLGILNKNNFIPSFWDLTTMGWKIFREQLIQFSPDFIGMSIYTKTLNSVRYTCKLIKEICPKTRIIVGGAHITALPDETMLEIPEIDVGIIGEGEITLIELLKDYSNKEAIRGIIYRDNNSNKLIITSPRDFIDNLDELPFPAWEFFEIKNNTPFGKFTSWGKREFPLLTQRGCPFRCAFCVRFMGDKVRERSIQNVIKEIKHLVYDLKATHVAFLDETFNLKPGRTKQLCKEIIRNGLHRKIKWSCFNRVTSIDESVIRFMKAAGCETIEYGIESGSDEILRIMQKGTTFEIQRKAISLTRKYRIKIYLSVIIGHPHQTLADAHKDLNNVLKLRGDFTTFCRLLPFPGTLIYNWALNHKHGLRLAIQNWNNFDFQLANFQLSSPMESINFPQKSVEFFHTFAYIKMFLWTFPYSFVSIFAYLDQKALIIFLFQYLIWKLRHSLNP